MLHLQKFIERMRGHEARGSRDFTMPIADAKGMAADLTQLLLELRTYQELAIAAKQDEVIQVQITGGGFK
jgi:DNA primase